MASQILYHRLITSLTDIGSYAGGLQLFQDAFEDKDPSWPQLAQDVEAWQQTMKFAHISRLMPRVIWGLTFSSPRRARLVRDSWRR